MAITPETFNRLQVRAAQENCSVDELLNRLLDAPPATLLEKVINTSTDLVFVKDTALRTVWCNEAFASALGKKPVALIGHTDIENGWNPELVQGNPAKGIRGFIHDDREVLSGKTLHIRAEPANINGEIRLFDTVKVPLLNELGEITGLVAIARDITERQQVEVALLASEERFRTLVNAMDDLIFTLDREQRYIEVFGNWIERNSFIPADFLGKTAHEIMGAEAAAIHEVNTQRALSGTHVVYEWLAPNPRTGVIEYFQTSLSPIKDEQGMVQQIVGVGRNITKLIMSEAARRLSEVQFRNVIDASPVPFALSDEQHITYLNPAFVHTFGYTLADIPTVDVWWPKAYPDSEYRQWVSETWQERLFRFKQEGTPFEPLELKIQCKDGSYRTILASAATLEEAFGGMHLVIFYDISQRKQMEDEIRRLNEGLEQKVAARTSELQAAKEQTDIILRNVADAIILTDPDGKIRYANTAWEALTGYSLDEVLHENPRILQSGMTPGDTYEAMWKTILEGKSWRGILKNRRKNGTLYDAELIIAPVKDQAGNIRHFVGVQRDVTELIKLEKIKEKFIADAAHDLKNPITALALRLYSLRKSPQHFNEHIEVMEAQIQRLTALVNDLLTLARLDRQAEQPAREAVNPNQIITRIVQETVLMAEAKHQTLQVEVTENLPLIRADVLHLERIISNLLANGIAYTPENGTITLRTWQEENWIILCVRDTGVGISPSDLPRIFERFYRATQARKITSGTGLGLAIVKELVGLYEGKLEVESTPGAGSTFRVYLPLP